jgi:NAD(P)-dependent dehydrogenase (short-subunit alcohol dehydrogenase family)
MDGHVAVITGVGREGQVGETVAGAFASLGARCILLDRTAGEVQARAAELRAQGFEASAQACDLTDAEALDDVVRRLDAPHGVHALVCLAGGFIDGASIAETAPDTWHRLMSINLTTAYLTTRAFIPLVRQARGSIVYFASAAAIPGGRVAGMAAYAAAKTGVVTLMRAVAGEEKKHGVRANALAPTAIRTATNVASMGEEMAYVERDTVARWVTILCSEATGPISGQVVQLG